VHPDVVPLLLFPIDFQSPKLDHHVEEAPLLCQPDRPLAPVLRRQVRNDVAAANTEHRIMRRCQAKIDNCSHNKNLPAVVPRKADILNGLDPLVAVYGHILLSEHHLAG